MQICQVSSTDLESIQPLRSALWPGTSVNELTDRFGAIPADNFLVLKAEEGDQIVGFAEASIRTDYVIGCETTPVGFLEGIFVTPESRKKGVARALIAQAINWASRKGCREFASDALLDNHASHAFHAAMGFEETERIVGFRMGVSPG